MTYKGYTIEQIKELLHYDPETGEFISKRSGKNLVGRDFSHRVDGTKEIVKFWLARVAVMFINDDYIDDKDRVVYKDKDIYNLKADNLVVVPYREVYVKENNDPVNRYYETEEDYIFVGSMSKLFVVRRGPEQAVYRTYDKQEAIDVRNRWLESDKTLHEWDNFIPKWYKEMAKMQENE
jgi:hypothetical protein